MASKMKCGASVYFFISDRWWEKKAIKFWLRSNETQRLEFVGFLLKETGHFHHIEAYRITLPECDDGNSDVWVGGPSKTQVKKKHTIIVLLGDIQLESSVFGVFRGCVENSTGGHCKENLLLMTHASKSPKLSSRNWSPKCKLSLAANKESKR